MRRYILAGAGALALVVGAAPAALADATSPEGELSTSINTDCGVAVVKLVNKTDWYFGATWTSSVATTEGAKTGELHVDNDTRAEEPDGIPDGPAVRTLRFPEDSGQVEVTLTVDKGAESDWYPEQKSKTIETDCQDAPPSTTPPATTPPSTTPPADDGKDSTTPPADKSDDKDDKKPADDVEQVGDEPDEDGTAPTPEPQEAHIAVTG